MMESAPAALPARRCRRRWLCALIIGVPLLAVLLLSLAVYLLADAETVRRTAEQALGRPVTLGGLAPGFLTVGIVDVTVADTPGFGADPLLRLERAAISPDWSALLRGELRISSVTLTGAQVIIETDSDGRTNIDDLLQQSGDGAGALRLSSLGFDNCSVTYATPQRRLTLENISGTVGGLDAGTYDLDLAAAMGEGAVRLQGDYAPAAANLALHTEALPLIPLGLPVELLVAGAPAPALTADFTLLAGNMIAVIAGSGSIAGLLREFTVTDANVPWPLPSGDSLATAGAGAITLTADVRELRHVLPLAGALSAIDGAGTVNGMLTLDGTAPSLDDIVFSFRDCSLAVAALRHRLENLNGPFRVTAEALQLQPVTFTVDGLPFRGEGSIGFSPFTLALNIAGDNLDLARAAALTAEPLLPEGMTAGGNGAVALNVTRRGEQTTVSGTLKPAGASMRFTSPMLELTGIGGSIAFRGSDLAFEQVQATTCGGALTLNGRVGKTAAGLPFAVVLQADALALQPLAAAFGASHATTAGTLTGSIALSGDGARTATYHGSGELRVQQPQFADLPALTKLAPYLGLRDTALLSRFDSGSVAFTVQEGALALTQPLHLGNQRVALAVTGTVGLDGPLALRGQARVPSSSLAGLIGGVPLSALGGVRNEGDKTVIGFRIGGTYSAPSFGPDLSPGNLLDVPGAVLNAPADLAGSIGRLLRPARTTDSASAPAPSAPSGTVPASPLREAGNFFRNLGR